MVLFAMESQLLGHGDGVLSSDKQGTSSDVVMMWRGAVMPGAPLVALVVLVCSPGGDTDHWSSGSL